MCHMPLRPLLIFKSMATLRLLLSPKLQVLLSPLNSTVFAFPAKLCGLCIIYLRAKPQRISPQYVSLSARANTAVQTRLVCHAHGTACHFQPPRLIALTLINMHIWLGMRFVG